MDVEVRLPQWGMGMQEGEVVRWLKQEGESVQANEPLAEIEAAKVSEEVVAPEAGTLARIVAEEGRTVPVREVLAVISTDRVAGTGQVPPASAQPKAASKPGPARPAPATRHRNRRASPRVRRLAHELGVDLDDVEGSGEMLTETDVRASASQQDSQAAATVPLSRARRTIARRMRESVQTMAQVTLVREADVTDLVAAFPDRAAGPPYTAVVVRAAALALTEHPWLNARLDGDQVELVEDVHVGVAVSLDAGLIVPVVRDTRHKQVTQIADEIAELSGRARQGRLSPGEATGSTFTVTNLGMYGIDAFTPIINPPEAATLGVGRIADKPERDEGGSLRWCQTMTLSLTFDHRLVDGAPAARFLRTVCAHLEPALVEPR